MSTEIRDLIHNAQCGDENSKIELIKKFEPLIKKYSKYLSDDDSCNILTLFLLELIKKFNLSNMKDDSPSAYIKYIQTSLRHFCYKEVKSEKNRNYIEKPFSSFSEEEIQTILSKNHSVDHYFNNDFNDLIAEILNDRERQIMYFLYYEGYSVNELSRLEGISRQAINQTKKRALQKLREKLISLRNN
jgi:RNA polymerase sigma factor (sigma-70 family)